MNLTQAIDLYESFLQGKPLTRWIAEREVDPNTAAAGAGDSMDALAAAFTIKRTVGEVNTFIHAVGILACLPHVLEVGESVQSLSLGAGNTGKAFDLETDRRVAEFKFISWKGADAVRQSGVFADIAKMCLHPSPKRKYLYLTGADLALKFLRGGRRVESVLGRRPTLRDEFIARFGADFRTVSDFFSCELNSVQVVDLNSIIPGLAELIAGAAV